MPIGQGGLRDSPTWVWPEIRSPQTRSTALQTERATTAQQLRYLRELRARDIRGAGDLAEPCPLALRGDDFSYSLRRTQTAGTSGSDDEVEDLELDGQQDFRPPFPCSYLQPGKSFEGKQRVSRITSNRDEDWGVTVTIQEVDLSRGYLCGSMRAENVPQAKSPVVTFWEGEIVDNANFNFTTDKWGATPETDIKHWDRFPAFAPLKRRTVRLSGRCPRLADCPHVFMRWKEKFFVNVGEDCGLTIAGFYYVCLDRGTGAMEGFYFDPNSSPYQKLELRLQRETQAGVGFGAFAFR